MPAAAIIGGAVAIGSAVLGADQQRSAANKAADAQRESSAASIAEQQRQFDAVQKLLAPYVQGGQAAFGQQGNLIGLGGADQQQQAINALQQSPEFASLSRQGENAILQNAAATGGLRGGNVQGSLANFRSDLLSQLIGQQFNRLGAVSQQGLGAATQTGAFGQASSTNIQNALLQQGQASAGAALAAGRAQSGLTQTVGQIGSAIAGNYLGAGKF